MQLSRLHSFDGYGNVHHSPINRHGKWPNLLQNELSKSTRQEGGLGEKLRQFI